MSGVVPLGCVLPAGVGAWQGVWLQHMVDVTMLLLTCTPYCLTH